MNTETKIKKLWVLIGACLFQCALIGILTNSSGVLLAQIRTEYGLSLSRISSYHTIKGITGTLCGAFLTALFFRSKKPVFMGFMILLTTASYVVLIPGARHQAVWWLSAVLTGLAFCTSSVMLPYVLAQRFPEKPGTVTGIAMAFSGLGGIIFNPLCAWLIERFDWRAAIWVFSAITLVMAAGALLLLFGGQQDIRDADSVSRKKRQGTPFGKDFPAKKFFLCVGATFCIGLVMQFTQYVTMFAQDVGYTLQVGAVLTSVFMVGNVGGKLIFGYGCDKIGVYRTMMLTMGAIALGSVLLVFGHRYLPVMYIAVLLYGLIYSLSVISVSRCAMETYGNEGSKKYMGLHTSINSLLQALGSVFVGVLYDSTGSFHAQLLIGVGLLAFSGFACFMLHRLKTK